MIPTANDGKSHPRKEGIEMFRGIVASALSLGLSAAAAPAGLAQGAAPALAEQEAHAIGVDAYVYFYPLVTHGHHAQAVHEHRARQGVRQRPDEHVRQRSGIPAGGLQGRRARQFRHALFHCVARPDEGADGRLGAGHRRPLLSPADARHVDRRVRLAGLAHDRHAGGQLPGDAAWLERDGSGRE